MSSAETLDYQKLSQSQRDNIAAALEHFMFQHYAHDPYDERIEGDPKVRFRFRPWEGQACDLVLRRGNRFTLAEAKSEQEIGTARLQFENTITRIVKSNQAAVFGGLAVFIRRGPIYSTLPLNSTEGLGKHLVLDELDDQFRFDSAHSAKKRDKNYHVLLEASGDACLPIPKDNWGISRVVPPEIRVYVAKFRRPPD